jgi:hypothetical protein
MPTIERWIDVHVPVRTAYNQWTQFESFPQFMEGVREVRQLDDKRLHWRAMVGGIEKEWDAEITGQTPDQRVSWRSLSGAPNDGVVLFEPVDEATTRVRLTLSYEPENLLEKAGDALGFVTWKVEQDLKRFRDFIEGRGQETGAWRGEINQGGVVPERVRYAPTPATEELDTLADLLDKPVGEAAAGEVPARRARVARYPDASADTAMPGAQRPPSTAGQAARAQAQPGAAHELPRAETSFNAGRDPVGSSREVDERRSAAPQDRGEDIAAYPGVSGPAAEPNADPSWHTPNDLLESSDTTSARYESATTQLHAKVRENEELMARELGQRVEAQEQRPTLDGETSGGTGLGGTAVGGSATQGEMAEQHGPDALGGAGAATGAGGDGSRGAPSIGAGATTGTGGSSLAGGTGGGVAANQGRGDDVGGGAVGGYADEDAVRGGYSGGSTGGIRESEATGMSGGMRSGMGVDASGGMGTTLPGSDAAQLQGEDQPQPGDAKRRAPEPRKNVKDKARGG